jgi:thiol-disulfide isomerase/thioredoxin
MIRKPFLLFLFFLLCMGLTPSPEAFGQVPSRTVLIEEFTGEWCGWCPNGMMELEEMIAKYGDTIIVVAVHTSDPLESPSASAMIGAWANFSPSALINRDYDTLLGAQVFQTGDWDAVIARQIDTPPVCDVQLNYGYNPSSRLLTAEVKANFTENYIGDGRLNLYIVEDSVAGNAQHNYLSGDPQFIGTPFYALPDPIPGFIHEHVLREMVGESYGIDGIIPDTVTAGQEFSYSFTYTIPAGYNLGHLHLIGLVQQHKGLKKYRKILNSVHYKFDPAITGQENSAVFEKISIGPNPVCDQVTIRSGSNEILESVELYSLQGKLMSANYPENNEIHLQVNEIEPQTCILVIRTATGVFHKKLMISK